MYVAIVISNAFNLNKHFFFFLFIFHEVSYPLHETIEVSYTVHEAIKVSCTMYETNEVSYTMLETNEVSYNLDTKFKSRCSPC